MLKLFGYDGLSEITGVPPKTLKNWYSKDPEKLPPAVIIPGARGPRWTEDVVKTWIKDHLQMPQEKKRIRSMRAKESRKSLTGSKTGKPRGRPRLPPVSDYPEE